MRHLKHLVAACFLLASVAVFAEEPPVFAEDPPRTMKGKDGAEMALVPGGRFIMGTDNPDIAEVAPLHSVHVDAFYMDKYEVTNEKFATFLNAARPAEGVDGKRWKWVVLRSDLALDERTDMWPTEIIYEKETYAAFSGFEKYPVITVSWEAAYAYCKWAGKRLPTEAEWEKAARGGLKKKVFSWGDEIPTGGLVFNKKWRHNEDPPPTAPVGNYHPNGYGLYDMAGSVWEWCSDWFHPGYYRGSPKKNPKGPPTGMEKVLRGGAWYSDTAVLKVAMRNWSDPEAVEEGVGFRCVIDAGKVKK
jgi:formylglycine-generating enzyme required for sulfatase activity